MDGKGVGGDWGVHVAVIVAAAFSLLLYIPDVFADSAAGLRQNQRETAQQLERFQSRRDRDLPDFAEDPATSGQRTAQDHRIHVENFSVYGVSQFSIQEVSQALSPYTGRSLNTEEIHEAADTLMYLYRDSGFFTAKVFIPPQHVHHGLITLHVYEGFLEPNGIEVVNNGQLLCTEKALALLEHELANDKPINRHDYERALLLLEDLPGVHARSTLYPGEGVGTARLRTEIVDEPRFSGNVEIDNFGSQLAGRWRSGVTFFWHSPSQVGDELVGRLVSSGKDSNYLYLDYLRPVLAAGTRIGANLELYDYYNDQIAPLGDAEGEAAEFAVYLSHPVIRSRHSNLALKLSLNHLSLDDRNEFSLDADRTINAFSAEFVGEEDHDWLANGVSFYEMMLTNGKVDIDGDQQYLAYDQSGPRTDSRFTIINLKLARLQHLHGPWSVYGKLTGQWTPDNLDASYKMYFGGPNSIAAYPSEEDSADIGAIFDIELRRDIARPVLGGAMRLEVQYQSAWFKRNAETWIGWQGGNLKLKQEEYLQGVGVGFLQNYGNEWLIRGVVGVQVGKSPVEDESTGDNHDGLNKDYRTWLEILRYF
ncbi:ShlB/FhaC/HecB family hemolysin secretion/activation protein [Microbulbifer mangrovi]|uniref:ShlB/FhaC/HecB family hemolysin secretion/activation protein n=1 Tax=Microbulbifer mangrovi TaxID=927787 RepID=UPI0009908CE3|nr:POTRA domain-containing protein [Microbulbifer mangrovi]